MKNKFFLLNQLIKAKCDIFLLGVIKLDLSFPDNLFLITDYNLFRRDRNKNEGGFIFPCKKVHAQCQQ